MTERSAVALAHQYARDVLSGKIPACKWTRLACKRHFDDLERSERGDWTYRFDRDAAETACGLIEVVPHIKGECAGRPILLEPWQAFCVAVPFGWVKVENGKRRFRRVYIEVPRGNGKSTMSSGVGLYGLSYDNEPGAEVYSVATSRDQARIVFRDAQHMARRATELREALGLQVLAHAIIVQSTASKFEALSSDHATLDGLNTHIAIIDELHAHKTREVYDVIETSIGKRSQSMLWAITTAGSNRTGICYEIRTMLTRVLEGVAQDDSFFGIIYSIDEGDPWNAESSWRKANPNWGVSVQPDVIAQLCAKAMQLPAAQANFKTKHLNVWVSADQAAYDVDIWNKCADPSLKREDLLDWECISGLDLAAKNDLACRADLYWRYREDGQAEFAVLWEHYTNREAVSGSKNSQYPGWEITGHLNVHEGDSTSQAEIESDFLAFAASQGVNRLAIDKYEGDYMAERLQGNGIEVLVVPMNVAHLSKPAKELDTLMRERRIRHNGDPVAAWALANVVWHYDKNDNVFPHKERPENKIDPIIALIICLCVALRTVDVNGYDKALSEHFEKEGVSFL